jgi:endonuclease YncB( thermonuclease family)
MKLYEQNNAARFEKKTFRMWMKIVDVYDGDTVTVVCFVNNNPVRWRCRLQGFDAPELRSKNEHEKAKAVLAREFLKTILPHTIFHGSCNGLDKYGRLLLNIRHKNMDISQIMIENGHGYPYNGGKKKVVE